MSSVYNEEISISFPKIWGITFPVGNHVTLDLTKAVSVLSGCHPTGQSMHPINMHWKLMTIS